MKREHIRYFKRKFESRDLSSGKLSVDSTAVPSVDSEHTLHIPTKDFPLFNLALIHNTYLTEPQINISSICSEQISSIHPCSCLVIDKKHSVGLPKSNAAKPPRHIPHRSNQTPSLSVWKKNTVYTSELSNSFLDNYRGLYSNPHSSEENSARQILTLKLNTLGVSCHKWNNSISKRRVQSAHFEEDLKSLSYKPNLEDDSTIKTLLSQLNMAERIIRQDDKPLSKVRLLKDKIKQSVTRSNIIESRVVRCCGRVFSHSPPHIRVSIIQRVQVPSSGIKIV